MPDDEGLALYRAAVRAGRSRGATFVEIGAWCGKSTLYLGAAAEETGALLFSVDHHHGSEENQAGWEHHDLEVVDPATGRIDTLGFWRRAVDGAGLGASVVGVVGNSSTIASRWATPLELCFIDGAATGKSRRGLTSRAGRRTSLSGDGWPFTTSSSTRPRWRPPYELWLAAIAFVSNSQRTASADPSACSKGSRRGRGSVRSSPAGDDSPAEQPAAGSRPKERPPQGRPPRRVRRALHERERVRLGIDDPGPVRAVGAAVRPSPREQLCGLLLRPMARGRTHSAVSAAVTQGPVDTQRTPKPVHHEGVPPVRCASRQAHLRARRRGPGSTSPWRTRALARRPPGECRSRGRGVRRPAPSRDARARAPRHTPHHNGARGRWTDDPVSSGYRPRRPSGSTDHSTAPSSRWNRRTKESAASTTGHICSSIREVVGDAEVVPDARWRRRRTRSCRDEDPSRRFPRGNS